MQPWIVSLSRRRYAEQRFERLEERPRVEDRNSGCESNEPDFTAKAADVVGLWVAPPEKAIVLCIEENALAKGFFIAPLRFLP